MEDVLFERFGFSVSLVEFEDEWEVSTNFSCVSDVYFFEHDDAEAAFENLKTCSESEFKNFGLHEGVK